MSYFTKSILLLTVSFYLAACGGSGSTSTSNSISTDNSTSTGNDTTDPQEPGAKMVSVPSSCSNGLNVSADSQWCWIKPAPQGNQLNKAIFANGQWTAVGDSNTIMNSADLANWDVLNLRDPRQNPIYGKKGATNYAIEYSNNLYVVATSRGKITSTDATTWTTTDSSFALDVHYGNGLWVSTSIGSIETSPDGSNWTKQVLPGTWFIDAAFYGNDIWVIVGTDGYVGISSDGMSWTNHSIPTAVDLTDVIYSEDKGLWVAVGYGFGNSNNIFISTDAINWQAVNSTTTGILNSIDYNNNQFVVAGSDGIFGSNDASSWQPLKSESILSPDYDFGTWHNSVKYSAQDAKWLVVGHGGDILQSLNGVSWVEVVASGQAVNAIHHDDATGYVAVGRGGQIISSDDGISWGDAQFNSTAVFSDVDFFNGTWIAVGNDGRIYRSSDRQIWASITSPTTNSLRGISHDPMMGRWVAVGMGGTILSSDDGINWTARNSGLSNNLNSLYFAANQWIAVGDDKTILSSIDGIFWSKLPYTHAGASGFSNFEDVTYANNQWVAVGSIDMAAKSDDGINWLPLINDLGNARSITYGNNEWRVTGLGGEVVRSTDLVTWTEVSNGSLISNSDIIFAGDKWIVVSNEGGMSFEKIR